MTADELLAKGAALVEENKRRISELLSSLYESRLRHPAGTDDLVRGLWEATGSWLLWAEALGCDDSMSLTTSGRPMSPAGMAVLTQFRAALLGMHRLHPVEQEAVMEALRDVQAAFDLIASTGTEPPPRDPQ